LRLNEDEGFDPDRPGGMQAPFDAGEYMMQSEAFVALLRGVDPNKPSDPEARIRTNAEMDGQIAALGRAVDESIGTSAPPALPNLG